MASDKNLNLNITATEETGPATDKAGRNFDRLARRIGDSGQKSGDDFGLRLERSLTRFTPRFLDGIATLAAKAGKILGDGLMSSTDAAAQDLPLLFTPQGLIGAAILAVIGGSLAGAAAAAVAAAVTAAFGFGFLAIGAYILKSDPVIQAAIGRLKKTITTSLGGAAAPLQLPFTGAIDSLSAFVKTEGPQLKQIFQALAPVVQPLADAFLKMAGAFTPGIVKLATSFTNVFTDPTMLKMLTDMGTDINAFFTTISNHKTVVENVFKAIIVIIDYTLGVLNVLINVVAGVGDAFEAVKQLVIIGWKTMVSTVLLVIGQIIDGAAAAFGWIPGIGPKLKDAAKKFDGFRDSVNASLNGIHDVTINLNLKTSQLKAALNHGTAIKPGHAGTLAGTPYMYAMGGSGRTVEQAREAGQAIDFTSTVYVDGQFATRRAQRVVSANNRRIRVGVR